jgi:PAS domain S-box-containing protein
VWRIACREMARRAEGGTLLYPLAVALIGLAGGLHRTALPIFVALVAFAAVLAASRLLLIRRFDRYYDRSPGLWRMVFLGGGLTIVAMLSGLLYVLLLRDGLTPAFQFALTAAVGIAAMAIVIYSHSLPVVWSYILLLGIPPALALFQLDGPSERWLSAATLGAVAYLLWVARQQHEERWRDLGLRHALQRRAASLEWEQRELQTVREELEQLVEERTVDLESKTQSYRRIFESAHDPIIIFRPTDEKVLNVNRRACELYGFTREEFLHISLADISENVGRGQVQIQETLDSGVYHNFESVQRRKDGSRMFLEINASKIEYDGETAVLSINRDVTERRRAEELRLAKEAAERTARIKTQFLANMSHEIRTPMAGVIGLADLLRATDLDEQQARFVGLLQTSAAALLRVIDDILDFSKIEAGKLTIETSAFDLRAALREIVDLLRLGSLAKGTTLELHVDEDVPSWVRGDPGRLRQVLLNLVGNAVKFTDGGGVTVTVQTAAGQLRLEVRDTGIGIAPEAQTRLFELFSQADDSTARRFGGTGLGLAISKRIVEAMGGEIGFESEPEKGSTFWIRIPLEPAAPPAEPAVPAGRPALARRILAAEDNPINQLVISEHLKSLGYEVTAVGNGLEALEALQTGSYDLVLMDCQMPHLDGYEATLRIRRLPGKTGKIPILALTAHAIREELEKCLAVGMNDYITKPFRAETLEGKLDRWLGSERSGTGAEPRSSEADWSTWETLDERQVAFLSSLRRETGPELIENLIAQFRCQRHLEDLHEALAEGDRAALKSSAHRLKGTSSLLGAVRLPRLCLHLEELCAGEAQEECEKCVALIEAEHARVVRGLTGLLEAGFPGGGKATSTGVD